MLPHPQLWPQEALLPSRSSASLAPNAPSPQPQIQPTAAAAQSVSKLDDGPSDTFGQKLTSGPVNSTTKANDSCLRPGDGAVQVDENYLNLRWSHTAKFLRDFTQRKAAQAEEIRRQRTNLQVLSAEERSAVLGTASSQPLLDKSTIEPLDTKIFWSEAISEQVSYPGGSSQRLRQSQSRGLLPSSQSGCGVTTSTTSLDLLLQNILQRSTAVSSKLTKAYAHAIDAGEPASESQSPPPRTSLMGHNNKKLAGNTGARGEPRARSQSRVQRHSALHPPEEAGMGDHPSPPTAPQGQRSQQQQEQQGRTSGIINMGVSPVCSRSSSPGSPCLRVSGMSQLQPQSPTAEGEVQPEVSLPVESSESRFGNQQHPQQEEEQQQKQKPRPPAQADAAQEDQQPQQEALHRMASSHQRRPSSGGCAAKATTSTAVVKNTVAARRGPFSRRALSHSLDGASSRRRRQSDGPYATQAGEGAADGPGAPHAALRTQVVRRRASGSGVRLPRLPPGPLGPVGSRSAGATSGREAREAGCAGGKRLDGSASGSSYSSNGGEPSGCAGVLAARRAAASFRLAAGRQPDSLRRSGSLMSHGLASPSGQSPWARSTVARELVFIQF
ncbi:hypothetical protein VOLCADRAFT_86316 [Volvox carteri f. nagariensis]|uniref:Uncharacterized protein n=1 Tax=Volvox carteri f. nagariensis TaxID=3068 RepID=D8TIG1_VOLCA|nr:uncharacterized protein VOLCADRAFT_86316 [Volvox carteri f. nagariensis]EFJ52884.1 hypothetical protein VOLCADRAFT_86316 [Volvox carteri f. nagariensis]|eukprot:XP_002945889.1 hypothetical protein VOLCADRAFT_86316 [Volvox carteri f. nagariensis]